MNRFNLGFYSRLSSSCQWRDRNLSDFIKKIFICVLKMNESLTGLEGHEGEELMTEFSFLGQEHYNLDPKAPDEFCKII